MNTKRITDNIEKIKTLLDLYEAEARETYLEQHELDHAQRKMKHIKKLILEHSLDLKKHLHKPSY